MNEERILLAHGNGGRFMRELISEVFARHLANPALDTDADSVALPGGEGAALIGRIDAGRAQVVLETELGGRRVLEELEDDPLPRIC